MGFHPKPRRTIKKEEVDLFLEKILEIYYNNMYIPKGHDLAYLIMIDNESEYKNKISRIYNFQKVGTLKGECLGIDKIVVYKK